MKTSENNEVDKVGKREATRKERGMRRMRGRENENQSESSEIEIAQREAEVGHSEKGRVGG